LKKDTLKVREEIQSIRYCMLIRGCSIRIKKYEGEKNYSEDILKTFEKFNEGPSTGNFRDIPKEQYASHIEEGILSILSRLFPEPFDALDRYCTHHACFFDATILHFAMDVQFYISFLNYLAPLREKKLPFCYPEITTESKEIHASGFFDIVLAQKLTEEGKSVVLNDFYLSSQERSMVISGPNQGGKTTFARSFAQIHYLASLGLPVPGRQARLFLPDRIFTHFEREEKVENFSGKLQEELIRMQQIFEKATDRSIIIINEIFSFTSLADALVIGKRIMRRITNLGCLCVCVTFLEELSRLNDTTVSMVSTVNPEKPEERTFTIIRKTADGLAYAISIARKHELTYEQIRKRLHQ
jgi:DNA mismatch repair ATPase MutS